MLLIEESLLITTQHNFREKFWDKIHDLKIDTHIIIGKLDTYYKNTNEVNAIENLNIGNDIKIYTQPERRF